MTVRRQAELKVLQKVMDNLNDAKHAERRIAITKAWQQWLHKIIIAMDEQRQQENLQGDSAMSGELAILMMELDECRDAGAIINQVGGNDEGDAETQH